MTAALDKTSPIPLYYQLFLRVQADIHSGVLRPGDLLGTEKDIQERYAVSRATVRKALDELARHGRLQRITGRGTFVSEPTARIHTPHLLSFTEEMERQGRTPDSRILEFGPVHASSDVAAALHVRAGTSVLYVRRLRTADTLPVLVVHQHLAPQVRLQQGDLAQSLYAALESRCGIRLQEAFHTITAMLPSEEEAGLLEMPLHTPVLRFERITLAGDGRPIVHERGAARADRYSYSVHLYRP